MSYCTEQIVLLAGNIYTGIGAPTSQSVAYVSGWVTSSGALGDINNRLGTSYYLSGTSPCIAGEFGPQEGQIMTLIYQRDYYFTEARRVLAGGGTFWTSMADGDTRLSRESATKVAREYRELSKDMDHELRLAIHDWKLNHSLTVSVNASPLASWPTP